MTFTPEFVYGATISLISGILFIVGYFVKRAMARWDGMPARFAEVTNELQKAIKEVVNDLNSYKDHNNKEVYRCKADMQILKKAHTHNHGDELPELPE